MKESRAMAELFTSPHSHPKTGHSEFSLFFSLIFCFCIWHFCNLSPKKNVCILHESATCPLSMLAFHTENVTRTYLSSFSFLYHFLYAWHFKPQQLIILSPQVSSQPKNMSWPLWLHALLYHLICHIPFLSISIIYIHVLINLQNSEIHKRF